MMRDEANIRWWEGRAKPSEIIDVVRLQVRVGGGLTKEERVRRINERLGHAAPRPSPDTSNH